MIIKYRNERKTKLDLKEIDVNNFSALSPIYSFTTENIAGYFEYLQFENKKILTVAGSGDHIINSIYKGAKEVCGFDINYLALLFTELKLIALENLEYEEFLEFFMINESDNIYKNTKALNYEVYKKIRDNLNENTAQCFDIMYQKFNNNGYELRNSYLFNNKYDNNEIKINSNIYLRSKLDYNIAKEKLKNKEITLINSNYRDLDYYNLQILANSDIVMMSNISDYIKEIYNINYLEKYISEIIKKFKNKSNKIVCAYLYDIENTKYRSEIDNSILRINIFDKLNITYTENQFKSVIDNCIDSVIII